MSEEALEKAKKLLEEELKKNEEILKKKWRKIYGSKSKEVPKKQTQ